MQRAFEGVLRHVGGGLRGIVFLDRNRLLRVHVIGAFDILFRLQHRRLLLKVRCLCGADRCLLLFEQRFVRVRFDLHQQVAFLHRFPVFDWKIDDFARHFRRDLHFYFGLNFPSRRNRLQDRLADRFLSRHRNWLLAFAVDDRHNDAQNQKTDRAVDNLALARPTTLFARLRRSFGRSGGLVHWRSVSRCERV